MTPQEALAQAVRGSRLDDDVDPMDFARWTLDALPEGWALAYDHPDLSDFQDELWAEGAQQERERLRESLVYAIEQNRMLDVAPTWALFYCMVTNTDGDPDEADR